MQPQAYKQTLNDWDLLRGDSQSLDFLFRKSIGKNLRILYLIKYCPTNCSNENDSDLILYFYEVPGVIWLGKSGELVAL